MKLLVTGRDGQVVNSLLERGAMRPGFEVIAAGLPELDLSRPSTVRETIEAARPDLVVSVAAYTAVDQAEDEPDKAFAINGAGAGAVAAAAAAVGAPVIHLSTDYVFSGDSKRPYREDDPTGPLSVYGRSKLDGELAVAAENARHIVLRTAWVYSPFGKNFVKTMLRLAKDRDQLRVVSDQWGNPTSALDIADAILDIAGKLGTRDRPQRFGTFHLTGSGEINWSGFAERVFSVSRELGGPWAAVEPITTSDYPTPATRPANSRLDGARLASTFGISLPDWRESTRLVVERLLAGGEF